ncbi:MAG: FHA domain-containing protein [Cyanothece sp. SIO1E1]|nr:FHA domain-containing protein [Cyanothece sp. SIO1E1]
MITLSLLHPLTQAVIQTWTFEQESLIRIGRSTDNHVVLYSAVVSRHHVELRRTGLNWEVINLGANGTYLNGKRITQASAADGNTIRLARSGPNIQIRFGAAPEKAADQPLAKARIASQSLSQQAIPGKAEDEPTSSQPFNAMIPVPPHLELPSAAKVKEPNWAPSLAVSAQSDELESTIPNNRNSPEPVVRDCQHQRAGPRFCLDCGQPLQPIDIIEDYQIVEILGQGEIGITYWVWQAGRNLALKTLNPDWIDQQNAQVALDREAEILYQLDHPRIPHFGEYFRVQDQPYLAMELIQGQSLADRVAEQGPVSVSEAVDWMLQVCDVLMYLHQQIPSVVHRSINPKNLIRQTDASHPNQIAVVDFGGLKTELLGLDIRPELAGFIAPEQQVGQTVPASDLYAIGATLIYLLSGQIPGAFYGDPEQSESAQGKPFQLLERIPNLTPALADVIATLIHSNPDQRYLSPEALAVDLQAIAAENSVVT